MIDMTEDIFAKELYGRIALKKLKPVPENFRFYCVEWMGSKPGDREIIKIDGAEFRAAKSGPNKGKLCIMVKGTKRTAYLTARELGEADSGEVKP